MFIYESSSYYAIVVSATEFNLVSIKKKAFCSWLNGDYKVNFSVFINNIESKPKGKTCCKRFKKSIQE